MILLDGKSLSEKILSDLSLKIKNSKLKINLDIILVGDDPSSLKYIALKQKQASRVGIGGQLYQSPLSSLLDTISNLNANKESSAFFIQLPIPGIRDNSDYLNKILPQKDADGLNPNSGVSPAVVRGILSLLKHYQISFDQKNIVIVNDSNLIGQPLKKYFDSFTPDVTLLNNETPDLSPYTQKADILISATGVKNLITADMVKEGGIVIDVANGDVDFTTVSPKCSYVTPTFGGVGPMTVASLLENTYDLATK